MRASPAEATADLRAIEKGARCAMRMLAVAVAFCAALAAQPAADLDQLFHVPSGSSCDPRSPIVRPL